MDFAVDIITENGGCFAKAVCSFAEKPGGQMAWDPLARRVRRVSELLCVDKAQARQLLAENSWMVEHAVQSGLARRTSKWPSVQCRKLVVTLFLVIIILNLFNFMGLCQSCKLCAGQRTATLALDQALQEQLQLPSSPNSHGEVQFVPFQALYESSSSGDGQSVQIQDVDNSF